MHPVCGCRYDTMELFMPLYSCNHLNHSALAAAPSDMQRLSALLHLTLRRFRPTPPHEWFHSLERRGDHTMRYFIEPLVHTRASSVGLPDATPTATSHIP
jgi:hypothetical protein